MRLRFSRALRAVPMPAEFLEWQVKLRRWTMLHRHGAPHAGVAPLVCVRQPGTALGVSIHSVICGLLPRSDRLEATTREFRAVYERAAHDGASAIYDAGIAHLVQYYDSVAGFDPCSITSLLPATLPLVDALRHNPACALLFYVFDLDERSEEGRYRCLQLDCRAELHERGPVFENVWWHNALFHGKLDGHVVLRFLHQASWDTRFGVFERLDG